MAARHSIASLAIRLVGSALGTVAVLLFSNSILGNRLENLFFDMWFNLRPAPQTPHSVVLVAMDEASYQALQVPLNEAWPRRLHARLLRRLHALGATRVVFDVVFAAESKDTDTDRELGEAISLIPTALGVDHGERDVGGLQFYEVIPPHPTLARYSAAQALVGVLLDDGVARRFLAERRENTLDYPTLAEAGAGLYQGPSLRGSTIALPTARDFINYYGPPGSIRTFSYHQLLDDEFPLPPQEEQEFRGATVYVGLALRTGVGPMQKDSYSTPYGDMFGVEIHATAAANILENDWLHRFPPGLEASLLAAFSMLSLFLIMTVRPLVAFGIFGSMLALWSAAAYGGFLSRILVPGASAAIVGNGVGFLTNVFVYYVRTRRRQLQVERAFRFYLSPHLVAQLAKSPDQLRLGGKEVLATALFTDIEGFTSVSERMTAEQIVAMLIDYFSELGAVVLAEEGTLLKFIGDALFVVWGAPLEVPDHAVRACRAAARIQEATDRFNARGRYPNLVTRVGLSTGKMVVGNLGSRERFDYTAIGDTVNIASRMEGVNKYLGTAILVTEDTYEHAKSGFTFLRMGAIRVVGKEVPVHVYALLMEDLSSNVRSLWETALAHLVGRRWAKAREQFELVRATAGGLARAAEFYLEQIAEFEARPPGARWAGEIVLTSK